MSKGLKFVATTSKTDHVKITKMKGSLKILHEAILCTIDIGLYPNIPHYETLTSPRRYLEPSDKNKSEVSLIELTEVVLEFDISECDEKAFKQVHGTVVGATFAPRYAIF